MIRRFAFLGVLSSGCSVDLRSFKDFDCVRWEITVRDRAGVVNRQALWAVRPRKVVRSQRSRNRCR